jgi:hypothetical protein
MPTVLTSYLYQGILKPRQETPTAKDVRVELQASNEERIDGQLGLCLVHDNMPIKQGHTKLTSSTSQPSKPTDNSTTKNLHKSSPPLFFIPHMFWETEGRKDVKTSVR